MRYAFIGLGTLGARLAARLTGQFELTVHDRDAAAGRKLLRQGASWAAHPGDAARDVAGVITCLPAPAASREVMLGHAGALARMKPGSCWIEMSTVGPQDVAQFVEAATERQVDFLECPLTGGIHRAARGEMTMYVGGAAQALARHRPVLERLCHKVLHLGAPGSASITKLLTNMLCMVDLIAAADALLLARRAGLDLEQFYHAVVASSGNSREFEDWVPRILDGSLDTGFTLALALKDLSLVGELSRTLEVPLALSPGVSALLERARARYGDDAWTPTVVKMMAEEIGVDLSVSGKGAKSDG